MTWLLTNKQETMLLAVKSLQYTPTAKPHTDGELLSGVVSPPFVYERQPLT